MRSVDDKTRYDIDAYNQRNLGWSPVAHARTLTEATDKLEKLKTKHSDLRIRDKSTKPHTITAVALTTLAPQN